MKEEMVRSRTAGGIRDSSSRAQARCNVTIGTGVLVLSSIVLQRGDVTGGTTNNDNEAIAGLSVDRVRSSRGGDSNSLNVGTPRKEEREEGCKKHHGGAGAEGPLHHGWHGGIAPTYTISILAATPPSSRYLFILNDEKVGG
jgi:hypothetical protein